MAPHLPKEFILVLKSIEWGRLLFVWQIPATESCRKEYFEASFRRYEWHVKCGYLKHANSLKRSLYVQNFGLGLIWIAHEGVPTLVRRKLKLAKFCCQLATSMWASSLIFLQRTIPLLYMRALDNIMSFARASVSIKRGERVELRFWWVFWPLFRSMGPQYFLFGVVATCQTFLVMKSG